MTKDDISQIRMSRGQWGKTRAYCTVTFTNGMTVDSIRVMEGRKGLFVSLPSRRSRDADGNETWKDFITFEDREDFEALQSAILEAYRSEGPKRQRSRSRQTAPSEEETGSFWD